jgi:hypothetical protein
MEGLRHHQVVQMMEALKESRPREENQNSQIPSLVEPRSKAHRRNLSLRTKQRNSNHNRNSHNNSQSSKIKGKKISYSLRNRIVDLRDSNNKQSRKSKIRNPKRDQLPQDKKDSLSNNNSSHKGHKLSTPRTLGTHSLLRVNTSRKKPRCILEPRLESLASLK